MVQLLWLKYGMLDLKKWVQGEEYLLDFIAEMDTELKPFIDMLYRNTFHWTPAEYKEWLKGIDHKQAYFNLTTGKEYPDMHRLIKNLAVRDRLLEMIQYQEEEDLENEQNGLLYAIKEEILIKFMMQDVTEDTEDGNEVA